jgi:hypothetical protein
MNKKYFFFWLTIVTMGIILFSACQEHVTDINPLTYINPVTGISLNEKELFLFSGEAKTLIATVYPDNATNKTVTWTSSNPSVATVNANGLVTAIADGKATIAATTQDGYKIAECDVIVNYRNKWIGDWDFEVKRSWFNSPDSGGDTLYYLGKISLVDDLVECLYNLLNIEYLENRSIILKVDENGELFDFPTDLHYKDGHFEGNDKIALYLEWGGLGGGTSYFIDGIKRKGGKNE